MIFSVFLQKWLQNHQETIGFIRVPCMHFAVAQNVTFPMNCKGLQHRKNASQNGYKHNAFLMILSAFWQKWLQNHQETTSFIRVSCMHFAATQNVTFSNEF